MTSRCVGISVGVLVLLLWIVSDLLLQPGLSAVGVALGCLFGLLIGTIIAMIWQRPMR